MRTLRWALAAFVSVSLLSLAPDVWAQAANATVTPSDWKHVVATALNTTGVMLVVFAIKHFRPFLADRYGWAMPLLATILGPVIAVLQGWLAAKLGYQIDFSMITAALSGAAGVAVHQVYQQAKEGPTGIARQ